MPQDARKSYTLYCAHETYTSKPPCRPRGSHRRIRMAASRYDLISVDIMTIVIIDGEPHVRIG
jgi:hypothetical protein